MISAFLSALFGKCPACGRGKLYKSFLTFNELCPVCHVRFERWSGSWTIPTVMGYGAGALFAIGLGFVLLKMDRLEGAENIIIPATLVFTALFYPVCKNVSMFMLFQNGFVFVDPPALVPPDPEAQPGAGSAPVAEAALASPVAEAALPVAEAAPGSSAGSAFAPDEPTHQEPGYAGQDDPTDGGGGEAA